MKKLILWAESLIENVIIGMLIVLVTLTFVQVVFRYVLSSPLVWSEEIIRYCLIWIVLLGTGLGLKNDAHIGIDFFFEKLPEKAKLMISLINLVLVMAVAVFLMIIGSRFSLNARGSVSPAIGIPNILVFSAIPISAATWLLFLVCRTIDVLLKLFKE